MTVIHYVNGSFVEETNAQLSVLDLGLLRGYGVFDYTRIYEGRPFYLRAHIDRLRRSAHQVDLELPMLPDQIEQVVEEVIRKNGPINAGIRIIITGGLTGKDLLLPRQKSSLVVLFHPFSPYGKEHYQNGMRAVTTSGLRFFPHVKTTNYMPAIFAMKKAVAAGADDALYLNQEGGILEGTTSNIFFVKKGTLITDDSDQIVKGVTREIVLHLGRNHYPIEYRAISVDEAVLCDEAFLTSSTKEVMPLVEIDHKKIGNGRPGVVSTHLRSLFHAHLKTIIINNTKPRK